MEDRVQPASPFRGMPADGECLVCFAKLEQTGVFGHMLWEGEEAKFCSQGCLEIFQNNPASFMQRLKVRVRNSAITATAADASKKKRARPDEPTRR